MKKKMKISSIHIAKNVVAAYWTKIGGPNCIESKQKKHLREKVEQARTTSPLFKEMYKHLPPSNEIHLTDLPLTYKKELMENFDDWIANGLISKKEALEHMADITKVGVPLKNCAVVKTSGTSGEPLIRVIASTVPEAVAGYSAAQFDRKARIFGYKIVHEYLKRAGAAVMIMGGSGHFAGTSMTQMMGGQAAKILGTNFIAAEKPIEEIVSSLNDLGNVVQITTYPSMLTLLVKEKEEERLQIEPKIIKLAGETFTKELRKSAGKAFPKALIQNAYACSESPTISVECSKGRFHAPEDWIILEAVDEDEKPVPDGEVSDAVLLSNLYDDVQPFIRYKMSDRIKFFTDKCPCGSPFKSFKIMGREATILRIDGKSFSALTMGLEYNEASRVQLIQISEKEFEARADVKKGVSKDKIFERIEKDVNKFFNNHGIDDVVVKKSLEPPELGKSGKFHEVIPLKKGKNE